ncbi:MAG: hypothetical protein AB7E70_19400 [Hyphomicrobiaceae bacterium]
MADDLPIKITLDPGPASRGAQKVAASVATIEGETKKSQAAVKQLERELAQLEREAAKAAKAAMQINFKQAAAGANQFFQLLNQNLKITDGAFGQVIDSATKFGAAGAQLAGPWGAAIGAIVGVTSELIGQIDELEKLTTQYKLQSLANEQFIYEMKEVKGILDGTAGSVRDIRDEIDKLFSDKGRAKTFFEDWEKGRSAVVLAEQAAEAAKNEMIRLGDISDRRKRGEHVSPAEIVELRDSGYTDAKRQYAIEQYTKATKELELNQRAYGDAVKPILNAEQERATKLGKLKAALDDTSLTQREHNAIQAEYNKLLGITAENLAELERLRLASKLQDTSGASLQRSIGFGAQDIADLQAQFDAAAGVQSGNFQGFAPIAGTSIEDSTKRAADAARELKDAWASAVEEVKKLDEKTTKIGDILANQFVSSAQSFASALTDASHGADVSWSSTFENILRGLEQAIAQALILKALTGDYGGVKGASGYGGLFGLLGGGATGFDYLASNSRVQLPGFATGGDVYTRGAGPTDSMIFAARITPGESVHVRTPEQRREALRGQGGGLRVVQVSADPRALAPSVAGDDEDTVLLRFAANNRDKLKRLLA